MDTQPTTIDITPDTAGLIAFARKLQREAPAGSADAATALKILAECGVDPDHRLTEAEFRRAAPNMIDGIEIIEITQFAGGSVANGTRATAIALTRTGDRFSTHELIYRSEDREFFLHAGHYDIATETAARADAAARKP